jgi:hypothetical protein
MQQSHILLLTIFPVFETYPYDHLFTKKCKKFKGSILCYSMIAKDWKSLFPIYIYCTPNLDLIYYELCVDCDIIEAELLQMVTEQPPIHRIRG